jgi:FAD/FMN-containing dehydrogenase
MSTQLIGACALKTEFHGFSGELIWPDDAAYEATRLVYNRRIDMRPALIARCRGNADVMAALRWARERDLEVAVRCVGNNYNGFSTSDGGVVIDLSLTRSVRVDPGTASARVGGGTLTGDILREGAVFDLAPAIGVMGATGVGLILGGGFGHLRNRAGWGADNILAADLVTADGRLVRVSNKENPDLLWALRGAGANFGVVTSLDIQLHSMPRAIVTGTMIWGEARLEEGMRAMRDVSAQASEDLSISAWLKLADDPDAGGRMNAEAPPRELRNRPCLELLYCHWGTPDQAAAEVEMLRRAGRPDFEAVGTTSFRDLHYRWTASPTRIEWDGVSVSELNGEAIGLMADIARSMAMPGAFRCIELFDQRGATSREPSLPSAQPRAGALAWSLRPGASSASPDFDDANDRWVLGVMKAVLATSVGIPDACALNSTSWLPTEERIRTHYGAGMGRLLQLKRAWDPNNVFRKNQNVDPSWA